MAEQQIYFVHARRAELRYDHQFLATTKSDAEKLMREYVTSQLQYPMGSDLAEWQFSVNTKEEEKTFRALNEKRPI